MYVEGDVPYVGNCNSNNNGNGIFGENGFWTGIVALVAVAAIFGGWGNGGGLFGGGRGGNGGNETLGYQLGNLATQADIAAGFNNSAVLSSLNDLKLGQQTGFANVQATLCQGFGGVNTALVQQGYETRLGLNGISSQIASCCCDLRAGQADLKYTMASDTCDIKQTINNQTQAILGWLTQEKISALQSENAALTAQLSQNAQTRTLIDTLRPCPQPAYITCSPYESVYGFNRGNCNCGCSYGANIQ